MDRKRETLARCPQVKPAAQYLEGLVWRRRSWSNSSVLLELPPWPVKSKDPRASSGPTKAYSTKWLAGSGASPALWTRTSTTGCDALECAAQAPIRLMIRSIFPHELVATGTTRGRGETRGLRLCVHAGGRAAHQYRGERPLCRATSRSISAAYARTVGMDMGAAGFEGSEPSGEHTPHHTRSTRGGVPAEARTRSGRCCQASEGRIVSSVVHRVGCAYGCTAHLRNCKAA